MIINKYAIILVSFLTFLLSEAFYYQTKFWYIFIILAWGIIIWFLKKTYKQQGILLSILPVLFYASSLAYLSVIVALTFYIHFFLILISLVVLVYFKFVDEYINQNKKEDKLINFILLFSLVTIFTSSATLYTLPVFINWHFWTGLLLAVPVIILLLYQFKVFFIYNKKRFNSFWLINSLALVEIFYVISLLPLNFNLLAFLNMVIFYLFCLVAYLYLKLSFNFKNIKTPLFVSGILIFILLLTTQWL